MKPKMTKRRALLRTWVLVAITAVLAAGLGLVVSPTAAAATTSSNAVNAVAYSPDGSRVAVAGQDARIFLYQPGNATPVATLGGDGTLPVTALAFSPDGRILASAGRDSVVRLWDPATGAQLKALSGHEQAVRAVAFSADGTTLLSGGEDTKVDRVGGRHRSNPHGADWQRGLRHSGGSQPRRQVLRDGHPQRADPDLGRRHAHRQTPAARALRRDHQPGLRAGLIRRWPPAAPTRRSGCGARAPARRLGRCAEPPGQSRVSPSAAVVATSPPAAPTDRCGSGTRPAEPCGQSWTTRPRRFRP